MCRPAGSVRTTSSDTWKIQDACSVAKYEVRRVAAADCSTDLGHVRVDGLPPDALVLDVRVEVAAAVEAVVDEDHAEVVLCTHDR